MEEKLYLSVHDGIAVLSEQGNLICRAALEGAGALCVGEESIFCADRHGCIWRFDKQTLMPQALSCGGPGICSLRLSACGERLYALLGEANSVLMSDAKTGSPLMVNRCGSNPRSLAVYENLLVAAAGAYGCVCLYDHKTLACRKTVAMPGAVIGADMEDGHLYALCMADDMSSLLIACYGDRRCMRRLPGMPGCLCLLNGSVYAATQGWLHVFSGDTLRCLDVRTAPGRADCLLVNRKRLLLHDPLSENVFVSHHGGPWKSLFSGVLSLAAM